VGVAWVSLRGMAGAGMMRVTLRADTVNARAGGGNIFVLVVP